MKHKRKFAIGTGLFSILALAVFAFSGLEYRVVNPQNAAASLGDAGNIKVTLTREPDNTAVTDGTFSFWCNSGEPITGLTDNGARDLNSTGGIFEITPTEQEKTDAACSQGTTLYVQYDSSTSLYVTGTQSQTYQTGSVNTITMTIYFPLYVDLLNEFGVDPVPSPTVTYRGNPPTLSTNAGRYHYWAIASGSGALSIQKTGYIPAETTNIGLSTVATFLSSQTSITFSTSAARSTPVTAGEEATGKGLQPNIKFVVTNPEDTPHNIEELVTLYKSIDGGAVYSVFSFLEAEDNIAYDAADPQYPQTKYRLVITNGPEVVSDAIAPTASSQQTITVRLPFTRGLANRINNPTAPEVVITPVTPPNPLDPKESSPPNLDPLKPPPPWAPIFPASEAKSPTSIQWNLPINIPEHFLSTNAILSRVEGEGKAKKLTLLKSIVLTKFSKDFYILEEGLEPGKLYSDRVLTIEGVEGNYGFAGVSTLVAPPVENKPVVLPLPNDTPKTIFMAIKEANTGFYLQADGTFDKEAEWRPWYQWGFAQKLPDGSLDPTKRVLYISQDIPEGDYKLEQYTKTSEDGPTQANTLIEIHYVPPVKQFTKP